MVEKVSRLGADKRRVKGCQELPEMFRVVSFGVDGDIDDLELLAACAKLLSRLGQVSERERTDTGAIAVAKSQRDHFSTVAAELEFGAVRSSKGEVRRQSRGIEDAGP